MISRTCGTLAIVLTLLPPIGIGADFNAVVSTVAGNGRSGMDGDGGDRRKASLAIPVSMVWLDAENLLYLDMGREDGGRGRRISLSSGVIETVIGGGTLAPDSVPARAARLSNNPLSLAVDSSKNIYIGYNTSGRVDRVDARTGLIARYAGGGDSLEDGVRPEQLALKRSFAIRIDDRDNIYIVDADLHAAFRIDATTGRVKRVAGTPGVPGHAGDGGPATAALLHRPTDIGWDPAGNLYIVDQVNQVVRAVSAVDGTMSTVAGTPMVPGFAGDGGAATKARLRYPESLLVEDGQLLVADRMNHRIRRVDLNTRLISTIAGAHRAGYAGENVAALRAGLFEPRFLLRDKEGGLLIIATRARRIYRLGNPVEIPVPWWRSGWAITAYLLSLTLLTVTVVQVRTRTLRERKRNLESLVQRRLMELREQQQTIKRQSKELAELIESRDRLLGRIAHEFRTPLTVILGSTRRLRDASMDRPFKAEVAEISRHAGGLLGLVEKLLHVLQLRHGYVGSMAPVAADEVLRRIIASLESRAADRGVRLELGSIQELRVMAHKKTLETVLVSLLSTAIREAPRGGRISVALMGVDGQAEFDVGVAGCSAEVDREGRLERPGAKNHGGEESRLRGEDVDPVVVEQLVVAQGGSLSVENEGADCQRVRMRLPIATVEQTLEEPAIDSTLSERPDGGDPGMDGTEQAEATVVVVEDNDDMRAYLRQLLTQQYRCALAEDGIQGVELVRSELPDVVVCDVMLPGQDGYAVCRGIKSDERTSHIPVILLTALEGREHQLRGLEERADDYLTKPFEEGELLQRIRNLLEVRNLLQRRYARELRFDDHPPAEFSVRDQGFLARLAQLAAGRYGDVEFDPPALAAALAVSERQLQRKLKALVGLTPAEYLRGYRLQQALERLRAGERPGHVAYAVGFSSQAYFSACFKAQFGFTPGEARERAGIPA